MMRGTFGSGFHRVSGNNECGASWVTRLTMMMTIGGRRRCHSEGSGGVVRIGSTCDKRRVVSSI